MSYLYKFSLKIATANCPNIGTPCYKLQKNIRWNKKHGVFYKIRVESKVETIKILMITSKKVS